MRETSFAGLKTQNDECNRSVLLLFVLSSVCAALPPPTPPLLIDQELFCPILSVFRSSSLAACTCCVPCAVLDRQSETGLVQRGGKGGGGGLYVHTLLFLGCYFLGRE